jgi:4-amino-4-deoxy-L-arabinose transferase-like glycosyltransferase
LQSGKRVGTDRESSLIAARGLRVIVGALALSAIAVASLALNLWGNDFAHGLHTDEPTKVTAIETGELNFLHPLVLIHAGRLAVWASGATGAQEVVEAGRTMSALFGTGIVLVSFFLFRKRLPLAISLAAAALLAATPLQVVHAHYLKEDSYYGFFLMLALLAWPSFVASQSLRSTLCLGIATGLALSAKYPALVLIVIYLLAPWVVEVGDRRGYRRAVGRVVLVALAVFAVVQAEGLWNLETMLSGMGTETVHVLSGHKVRIWGHTYLFGFHLVNSLVPGLSWGVVIVGLAGAVLVLAEGAPEGRDAPATRTLDRFLLLALVVLYLVIEILPMKAYPGFIRYALPLAPLLVYFAALAIYGMASRLPGRFVQGVAPVFMLALLGVAPAARSIALAGQMPLDTRIVYRDRIAALPGNVLLDRHVWGGGPPPDRMRDVVPFYDRTPAELAAADFVVTSSFQYERYFDAEALLHQKKGAILRLEAYRSLFQCPYEALEPAVRSFAFINPTLRIVNVRGCGSSAWLALLESDSS